MLEKKAKENPVKTNADVFEKVFGIKPNANNYKCPQENCEECLYCNFWDKEYKKPDVNEKGE